MSDSHIGTRFDRLPPTEETDDSRPSREDVLRFFDTAFGIESSVFEPYTLWERGRGKVWAFNGEQPTPVRVEAMGIHILRTRNQFWKPTTDGMQLFGRHASTNIVELDRRKANAFWSGETVDIGWDGDPHYVIVFHSYAGDRVPIGVGLARDSELESLVPKARRRNHFE